MRRLTCLALLACAVVACSDRGSPVGPADATPDATPSARGGPPAPDEFSYVSESCGFQVLVEGSGKVKVIELPGGRVKFSFPGYKTTFTNLETGEVVAISNTGSWHVATLANGGTEVVYTGRNTIDDPFAGELLLLIGRFSEVFGPPGVAQPLQGNGQIVDLCEALS